MDNKTKADRIFDLLPKYFNARADENWSGLVAAIGEEDERLAQLAEEVRKQFFVKTSSRPYIDRLAANNNLQRPRFVGMSDNDFRRFIPIVAYQPKQVKRIIDEMLDLFFLKDATTAFLSTELYEPFALSDTWDLNLTVDAINQERIVFSASDFTNIAAATANEVVAAYNRQAKYSYAITYYDSNTKQTYIRIFTNTIGAQGSMSISGGLANIGLELNGFLNDLGTGSNTQWVVTKIGNTVTFTYNAAIRQLTFSIPVIADARVVSVNYITGGAVSADNSEILIKNYFEMYYWKRSSGETIPAALKRPPAKVTYSGINSDGSGQEVQGEAVSFAADGSGYYTLGEGAAAHIYYYKKK